MSNILRNVPESCDHAKPLYKNLKPLKYAKQTFIQKTFVKRARQKGAQIAMVIKES